MKTISLLKSTLLILLSAVLIAAAPVGSTVFAKENSQNTSSILTGKHKHKKHKKHKKSTKKTTNDKTTGNKNNTTNGNNTTKDNKTNKKQ